MATNLRYKPASNGYETIYLDTCFNGTRKYKMLGFKVKCKPKSVEDKHDRKEKENFAKEIANQLDLDLIRGKFNLKKK